VGAVEEPALKRVYKFVKVAIVQEWLVSVGGSDKVVKAIQEVFPQASIYTLVYNKETLSELGFDEKKVQESFIAKLPGSKRNHRKYLPLFPFAIEQFDLSTYDVIISSSHSVAKGVLTNSNQLHICYCHSPMRYAWDLYHPYLLESGLNKGLKGLLARYFLHKIRLWDYASAARVDYFISNSNYIGKRIGKIYRRESTTIYPNIDLSKFDLCEVKEDYYIACSRLVSYKKIDLIVSAFTQWGKKKLIVVGSGPDEKKIRKLAGPNVEVLGYQPLESLIKLLGKAKAMVFAADEDFGMLPVEAQACGTPVIAFRKGGSLETILEEKTGLFFENQTEESIIGALERFEVLKLDYNPSEIRKWAEKFGEDRFKEEIREFVFSKFNEFAGA
jgi:glycosyltransferase involved in cell wall biosynthesis